MKMKGNGSHLYIAAVSHIMLFCPNNVWNGRFPLGKKPGINQATNEVANDLKQFISQRDNEMHKWFLKSMQIKKYMIKLKKK